VPRQPACQSHALAAALGPRARAVRRHARASPHAKSATPGRTDAAGAGDVSSTHSACR